MFDIIYVFIFDSDVIFSIESVFPSVKMIHF